MVPFRKRSTDGGATPIQRRLSAVRIQAADDVGAEASRSPALVSQEPAELNAELRREPQPSRRPTRPPPETTAVRRGRSIAISCRVMTIVGDVTAGLLLSQLLYWTQRGVDVIERDGWIFKTAHDWELETGLSWKVQRRARDILTNLDLIELRKVGMPARMEFRLKLTTFGRLLTERAHVEIGELDLPAFRAAQAMPGGGLLGRSFLFHSTLCQVFPTPSAMMCARLLAATNLPSLETRVLRQQGTRGTTRFVSLHRDRWYAETGLSRYQWETARRVLGAAGVLVERRHNFPRRIDLALDLSSLADVLSRLGNAETATSERCRPYRLDRAKQMSGFGQRVKQQHGSPDSADSDRQIQPLTIARSNLYLSELQGSLQPLLQRRAEIANRLPFATGWGSGGFYELGQVSLRLDLPTGKAATSTVQPLRPSLVWPSCFRDGDQLLAYRYLCRLPPHVQQTILDEIQWMQGSGKPVRSPVAVTRSLARQAEQATFVPDGAHRVAHARKESIRAAEKATSVEAAIASSVVKTPSEEVRAALARTRERIAGSAIRKTA